MATASASSSFNTKGRCDDFGVGRVTSVTGEQLEVALGGYSTWMTFEKLSG